MTGASTAFQVGVGSKGPADPRPARVGRDLGRIRLRFSDGTDSPPLNKRRAMLEAVRRLLQAGLSPEAIHQAMVPAVDHRRFDRIWFALPGHLDPDSFVERICPTALSTPVFGSSSRSFKLRTAHLPLPTSGAQPSSRPSSSWLETSPRSWPAASSSLRELESVPLRSFEGSSVTGGKL